MQFLHENIEFDTSNICLFCYELLVIFNFFIQDRYGNELCVTMKNYFSRKRVFNECCNNSVCVDNKFHRNRLLISCFILWPISSASFSVSLLRDKTISIQCNSLIFFSNDCRATSLHFISEWRFISLCNFSGTERVIFAIILRSEEHTSELQSHVNLVCRLLL